MMADADIIKLYLVSRSRANRCFMNISQAAALTGLSTKQIRDYEKAGLMLPVGRSVSGYRIYNGLNLERLHFIAKARQVGFSLEQIKTLLVLKDNPQRHSCDVKALTSAHIADIGNKIYQLQQMKDILQAWHDKCHGDERAECVILQSLSAS